MKNQGIFHCAALVSIFFSITVLPLPPVFAYIQTEFPYINISHCDIVVAFFIPVHDNTQVIRVFIQQLFQFPYIHFLHLLLKFSSISDYAAI